VRITPGKRLATAGEAEIIFRRLLVGMGGQARGDSLDLSCALMCGADILLFCFFKLS
jgi:hypothetical protein